MTVCKRILVMLLTLILGISMTGVAAFGASAAKKGPKLNKKSITLKVDKTFKLKVKGAKGKVKFKSNKKKVVSVNKKGKITAKFPGKAKITAKVGGKKLICKVKVVKGTPGPGKVVVDTADFDYIALEDWSEGYLVYQFRMFDPDANAWGKWIEGEDEVAEFEQTPIGGKYLRGETTYKFQQRVKGNKAYKESKPSAVKEVTTLKTPNKKLMETLMDAPFNVPEANLEIVWVTDPADPNWDPEWEYEYLKLKQGLTIAAGDTLTIPKDAILQVASPNVLNISAGNIVNNGTLWIGRTGNNAGFVGTNYTESADAEVWINQRPAVPWALSQINAKNVVIPEQEFRPDTNYTIKNGQTFTIGEDASFLSHDNSATSWKMTIQSGGKVINEGYLEFASNVGSITIEDGGILENSSEVCFWSREGSPDSYTTPTVTEIGSGKFVNVGDPQWWALYTGNVADFNWGLKKGFKNFFADDDDFYVSSTMPAGNPGLTIPKGVTITFIIGAENGGWLVLDGQVKGEGTIDLKEGGLVINSVAGTPRPATMDSIIITGPDTAYGVGCSEGIPIIFNEFGASLITLDENMTFTSDVVIPVGKQITVTRGGANTTVDLSIFKLSVLGTLRVASPTSGNGTRTATLQGGTIVVAGSGVVTLYSNNASRMAYLLNTDLKGANGATFNMSGQAASCTLPIFYPVGGGSPAAPAANGVYKWNANASGTGTAGWLSQ